MSGCCLYCKFADYYWIDKDGKKQNVPPSSFGCMHVFCLLPGRGPGECYPLYHTCSGFIQDSDERNQRRRKFFSQFPRFKFCAELIAQRR